MPFRPTNGWKMEANTVGATKPYALPHGTVSPCPPGLAYLPRLAHTVLVFTKLQIAESFDRSGRSRSRDKRRSKAHYY